MIELVENSGFPLNEHGGIDAVEVEMPTAPWPVAMAHLEGGASTPSDVGLPRCAIGPAAV